MVSWKEDQASGKEFGVAAVLDPDLAEHLSDDNFDVLIADINALQTVNFLDLAEQIVLDCPDSFDLHQVVRVDASFSQLVAGFNGLAVHNLDSAYAPRTAPRHGEDPV